MRLSTYVIEASWAVLLSTLAGAQVTQRLSVATDGTEGNGGSGGGFSVSADGRLVVFESVATNLVPGDTNGFFDVFVRDRQTGTTELASKAMGGAAANNDSYGASLSADGRYVAFHSWANNLVLGDTNGVQDLFVYDRQGDTTERVSIATDGTQANQESRVGSISAEGRYVVFESTATNLVPGDTNAFMDVFVRDRQATSTARVSITNGGLQASHGGDHGSISGDGRYVAFNSFTPNLVAGDTNGVFDVFVRDRQVGTTERVSVARGGAQANAASVVPSISADGQCVGFWSYATNLVPGDTNGIFDLFLRDRPSGTTERLSVATGGIESNGVSQGLSLSADGRFAVFLSWATNLTPSDTNATNDVFLRDRASDTTERVSVATGGGQANGQSTTHSASPIALDGRFVAFHSTATNLIPGDTNAASDVFIHDRQPSGFTNLCDPSLPGATSCPCGNQPTGANRGCDNSASTGGAILSASGVAYLSMDSLVFTTSGEMPTATSIVMQGNAQITSGVVFGQGVRCAGGMLLRLYLKTAAAGSITAPDFGAGDPTVSARSTALGDVIQAGQSRWYLVYYRDPVVLGGCPAGITFNATQTGRVDWSL